MPHQDGLTELRAAEDEAFNRVWAARAEHRDAATYDYGYQCGVLAGLRYALDATGGEPVHSRDDLRTGSNGLLDS